MTRRDEHGVVAGRGEVLADAAPGQLLCPLRDH
jgi:hypothetical protein